jgi:phosphatidylserine/phosphatidylglycerophosphate/cardiolipin synthase-like enzyme
MTAVGLLFVRILCDCFKSRRRLEAEILILRHQLNVLRQRAPRRGLHLRGSTAHCSFGFIDVALASLMP